MNTDRYIDRYLITDIDRQRERQAYRHISEEQVIIF